MGYDLRHPWTDTKQQDLYNPAQFHPSNPSYPPLPEVSWVHEVFGGKIGGHNSYWNFAGFVIDSTVYPLLAGKYLAQSLSETNP